MNVIKTKTLSQNQEDQINELWDNEYPIKLKGRFSTLLNDVENYNYYIIEEIHQKVIAWAVDFEKENEVRFSIIVHSKHQGQGLGRILLKTLKDENKILFGWVIDHDNYQKQNGTAYVSPLPFYIKNEFEILKHLRIETDILSAVKIKWCRKM